MKTKMHVMKGSLLGIVFLAWPLIMMAQDDFAPLQGPNRSGRGQGPQARMMEQRGMERIPDLTDKQKEDIEQIHLDARKEILPMQNEVREKEAHLNTLNTAEKTDMKAINSTIDDVYALKGDIAKRRAQARQEVRKLLTEEQRIVFDSHQPWTRGHRMGDGSGRSGGFGKKGCRN